MSRGAIFHFCQLSAIRVLTFSFLSSFGPRWATLSPDGFSPHPSPPLPTPNRSQKGALSRGRLGP